MRGEWNFGNFKILVISVKNIWTRNYSSVSLHDSGRVIHETATHGVRVAHAQSISVRQLDHSRNVKLDFSDEHLPKFKWYILHLVEYNSGGSETVPPTKILHRTFCFHDSMTLFMKDQLRTNLWNQYINNFTIRLYRRFYTSELA